MQLNPTINKGKIIDVDYISCIIDRISKIRQFAGLRLKLSQTSCLIQKKKYRLHTSYKWMATKLPQNPKGLDHILNYTIPESLGLLKFKSLYSKANSSNTKALIELKFSMFPYRQRNRLIFCQKKFS